MEKYEILLEKIFENSIESMIIFRENGIIVAGNKEAQFRTGYGEQLDGRNIIEIYPTVLTLENGKVLCIGNQKIEDLETVAYCSNQTCYPVILRMTAVNLNSQQLYICFAKNISERKEAQRIRKDAAEELEEATKMKNEFLANVTHELRTPVNGVKGLAENLLETELTASQKESLEIIIRSCNNMTKIISDLLDFSKIEAGKLSLEKREFNFQKFLDDMMAFHAVPIQEKGLRLIVNIGSDIPQIIIGDELRLGQIINNLFSNAIKFTSTGHIAFEVVKTFQSEQELELFFMVIDSGIGIAPEEMDRLFQSFSQVDGSITRRFGGTGLGLAISKQLVEMMGGTVHVDSEKDKGSTFSFSARFGLPATAAEPSLNGYPTERFIYSAGRMQSPSIDRGISAAELRQMDLEEDWSEKRNKALDTLEKLILCVEMGTWGKAENFAGIIKRLMPQQNQDLKRCAFRLELDIRKEDYDKATKQIKLLQELLAE